MIAWEQVSQAEAIAAGRDPNQLSDGQLWPDHIIEVQPTGSSGGNIVWEWSARDHLVQDYDVAQDNYGVVADSPQRIDVNYVSGRETADWNHINSIDYNAELDQILVSAHSFNEIWIIDHDTTTAEAAGSAGDLLYRWGNPEAYDKGTSIDRVFYGQHDAEWIEDGLPGAGNILVFNNGNTPASRAYSSVDELAPPLETDGSYTLTDGEYGPSSLEWTYLADPTTDFFADHISGSQRLANGNTLITYGTGGRLFEVTSSGEVVWEYDVGSEIFAPIATTWTTCRSLSAISTSMVTSTALISSCGNAANHLIPSARQIWPIGKRTMAPPQTTRRTWQLCPSRQRLFCWPSARQVWS